MGAEALQVNESRQTCILFQLQAGGKSVKDNERNALPANRDRRMSMIKTAHRGSLSDTAGMAVSGQSIQTHLDWAIEKGARHLLSLQAPEGYWLGELEADTTLESDYILYLHILGKSETARVCRLANYVRRRQLPDGGWPIFAGGPAELNATVKAYLALKLAGDHSHTPDMRCACARVHELGGLERTNSFTRFYCALVGAVGWEMVPAIPPELMSLPSWVPVNIYEMSSWTRAMVVPLTILYGRKPCWPLPSGLSIEELFRDRSQRKAAFEPDRRPLTARNFFLALDRLLKVYEKFSWKPGRRSITLIIST